MPYASLFEPLRLGIITLPDRIIMAPLTRMRAGAEFKNSQTNCSRVQLIAEIVLARPKMTRP